MKNPFHEIIHLKHEEEETTHRRNILHSSWIFTVFVTHRAAALCTPFPTDSGVSPTQSSSVVFWPQGKPGTGLLRLPALGGAGLGQNRTQTVMLLLIAWTRTTEER